MKRFLAFWLILLVLSWYPAQAARTFVDGQYLTTASAVVTIPFTMCAWFNFTETATDQGIMALGTSGTNGHTLALFISATRHLTLRTRDSGNTDLTASGVAMAGGIWHHGCGVWSDATNHHVYKNGVVTNGTHARVPTTMAATILGQYLPGNANFELNGDLGMAAFWDEALTAAEITALFNKTHPRQVRPLALVSCPHLYGTVSPEKDECGPRTWTLTGALTVAPTHPPVGLFSRTFGR